MILTNSILTGGGLLTACQDTNSFWIAGGSAYTNHVFYSTNYADAFLSFGAGNYYLPTNSSLRQAGSPSISTQMVQELKLKTTQPPIALVNTSIGDPTCPIQPESGVINLRPLAIRDTGSVPDYGYHYPALDYGVAYFMVTNATLAINEGTIIAYMHSIGGIWLGDGAEIRCAGSPLARNIFVSLSAVQEQPINLGNGYDASYSQIINSGRPNGRFAPGTFRFTDLLGLPGNNDMLSADGGSGYASLRLRDCRMVNGAIYWLPEIEVAYDVENNVFEYCKIDAEQGVSDGLLLVAHNNLFHNSTVHMATDSGWTIQDNAFDMSSFQIDVGTSVTLDHNAYVNGATNLSDNIQPSDIVTNLTWVVGPLGDYYQPPDSPLIDQGSTNADVLGLYHYTTQSNQVKEANSAVDVGCHYVALDSNGNPVDTNGDGVPDYLEDCNGNGKSDAGESPWSVAITSQPASRVADQGANANFTVVAIGAAPLLYQWCFNGLSLSGMTDATLNLTNLQPAQAGTYAVVVSNAGGSVTSSNAVLTVQGGGTGGVQLVPATEAALGWNHLVALVSSGDASAWGANDLGTLGDFTHVDSSGRVHIVGLTNIARVAAGEDFALAVDTTGQLWSWGSGSLGQLGIGSDPYPGTNVPSMVGGMINVVAIACGFQHGVAVKADGTVWTWGSSYGCQPTQVTQVANAVAVSAGADHSVALLGDGSVVAWGSNGQGQLGDGTGYGSDTPVQVLGLSNIVAICSGASHNLALDSGGNVWSWGANEHGQIGDGTHQVAFQPVELTTITGVVSIGAGAAHSIASDANGQVWTWGGNYMGQLGNGQVDGGGGGTSTTSITTRPATRALTPAIRSPEADPSLPALVEGLSNITFVAAGFDTSAALDSTEALWIWGNEHGQTNTVPTLSPPYTDFYNGQLPSIETIAGNGQSVFEGTAFVRPLVFRINDSSGSPIAGAPVSAEVISGDAELLTGTDGQKHKGLRVNADGNGQVVLNGYADPAALNTNCVIRVVAASRERITWQDASATLVPPMVSFDDIDVWYEAESLMDLTNGAAVVSWPSVVDASRGATTEANGAKPNPIFVTDAVNGIPVVRFQGGNGMDLPPCLSGRSEGELFAVLKAPLLTNAANEPWWLGGSTQGGVYYPGADGSIAEDFGSIDVHDVGIPVQPLNVYHVFNVSSTDGEWTSRINGAVVATTTDNVFGQRQDAPRTLGAGKDASFTGDLAEFITFNRRLSDTERASVESYLNGKYALVASAPSSAPHISAEAVSSQQVMIHWDQGPAESGTYYVIERKTGVAGTYAFVTTVLSGTTFEDGQLEGNTQYFYRVKAKNVAGESAYSNEAGAQTLLNGSDFPFGSLGLWLAADAVAGEAPTWGISVWPDLLRSHLVRLHS